MAVQMLFDLETRTLERFPGYFFKANGTVYSERSGKRVQIYPTKTKKYDVISLSILGGGQKQFSFHVLMCEAFHGPRPQGMECRHLDGDRRNNSASNLRWGTHSQNQIDMRDHGTAYCGERHCLSKLTEREVRDIRRMAATFKEKEIAAMFNVSQSTVRHIKYKRTWKHVG